MVPSEFCYIHGELCSRVVSTSMDFMDTLQFNTKFPLASYSLQEAKSVISSSVSTLFQMPNCVSFPENAWRASKFPPGESCNTAKVNLRGILLSMSYPHLILA